MIVLHDPTCDAGSRLFQAATLCRPDFFFLQAAMESFDVAVAFRVMIRRTSTRDAQPIQSFHELGGSKLCPIGCGQSEIRSAAALEKWLEHCLLDSIECFSFGQQDERFQPTISRVPQSITQTR